MGISSLLLSGQKTHSHSRISTSFPSHVDFFNTKSEAYRYLEREYLNHCKKEGIEDPYAEDSFDYQIGSDFAYIFGKYYWDIFEGDVEMV